MQQPRRLDIASFDPFRCKADDLAAADGYIWDPSVALGVQNWIENLCKLRVGDWRGQNITLQWWQQDWIWRLYGWVHKDTGLRRFLEGYLEVAKKNGKTPLVAAQSLYHLLGDGEPAPEVYINACSREQAGILYRDASVMVKMEPEFNGRLELVSSSKRIVDEDADGFLVANSFESENKDGVQSSFTIFDELHRQPNDELWNVFQYAGDSRSQPLLVSITTAGSDITSVCGRQHERALALETGANRETQFLGVVYASRDKNPDINDRKVWYAANPSMGVIIDEAKFAKQVESVQNQGPAAVANFKRLKLNLWTNEDKKFINLAKWNIQPARRTLEEIAEAGDVWAAGLDMAIKTDLNAYVRVTGNLVKGIDVFTKVWIPEDTAIRRSREENLPYMEYADRGFVELVPGSVMNPQIVQDFIEEEHAKFRLKYVLSDHVNTGAMAPYLVKRGVPFQHLKPSNFYHNFPTKTVESLYLQNKLRHGDDPMLAYCAGNACVDIDDRNDNMRLVKGKSTARIDAMIALVSAVAGLLRAIGLDGFGGDAAKKPPRPDVANQLIWI
ncbi:terminase large subunit [Paludisphaera rhizosphaerae]|uniref:terminase large subunit n=1 Tax=Paludisphaera rhizosphaerae TaxID=2711216 RepID=UPI0013EAE0F4|nr:terminase large subunit [Paludisphaera rhizosphaerae]